MAIILAPLALLILLNIALITFRLRTILSPTRRKPIRHGRRNPHEPTHLLIILGSGGHTAEMLSMLHNAVTPSSPSPNPTSGYSSSLPGSSHPVLNWRDFTHRTYLISSGDALSAQRAVDFETYASALGSQTDLMAGKVKRATDTGAGTYDVVEVPRAREIHQPLYTAPISCLRCAWGCVKVLGRYVSGTRDGHAGIGGEMDFPDLILCNGPATGAVCVGISVGMRVLNWKGCETRGKMRTVYVESWARVKRLSLSGRLLRFVVDRFIVQWPQLAERVKGAEYIGVLV